MGVTISLSQPNTQNNWGGGGNSNIQNQLLNKAYRLQQRAQMLAQKAQYYTAMAYRMNPGQGNFSQFPTTSMSVPQPISMGSPQQCGCKPWQGNPSAYPGYPTYPAMASSGSSQGISLSINNGGKPAHIRVN